MQRPGAVGAESVLGRPHRVLLCYIRSKQRPRGPQ